MSKESDVRKASADFYAALSKMANGDAGAMKAAWSESPSASAQHPIGGRDHGITAVLGSFAKVAAVSSGGRVAIADQLIDVAEDMAVESGIEKGSVTIAGHTVAIDHRVTNVYRLEDGHWKIRHHHTDLSPAMLDVLAKLKAGV